MAILSNDQFDATQIDVSTLELEGFNLRRRWWSDEDDLHPSPGYATSATMDMTTWSSHSPISDLMIEAGTQTVLLTGQFNDGTWFSLWDTVEVVP
ncbi:MAG: hypothetical protein R2849_04560 [Thermomicrobiales bacterium]